ncbi:hypothetical protein GF361_01700 [Candidatus Woesearchaeota archaeon]|nr:hypothetical protein [Candidatus Woesearchaeota archaeon]
MKQVGNCQNCGRSVYVNDIDLCKRCNQEVGLEILEKLDYVDEPKEDEGPSLEDLGLEEGSEVTEAEGGDREEQDSSKQANSDSSQEEPQKAEKKE